MMNLIFMAIWVPSLKEVEAAAVSIEKIKNKILTDPNYKSELKIDSKEYLQIHEWFRQYCKFLQYYEYLEPTIFFRVRPLDLDTPYTSPKDLNYKERDPLSLGRMNNPLIDVLYTSLSDQTAMLECNLNKAQVGKKFQLTRFRTTEKIKVYRLGIFADLYLNTGIDTSYRKEKFKHFLNEEKPSYRMLKGYAALETAFLDIMYADAESNQDTYLLSALLAHAIFNTNENRIDAIMYPSQKHRFGMNVAFKQEFADKINIFHTELKEIREIFSTGFFNCISIKECTQCDVTPYVFEDCEQNFELNFY